MGVRYKYRNRRNFKNSLNERKALPAAGRQKYYQYRYDKNLCGQLFALILSAFEKRDCRSPQTDLFADYAQKKVYDTEEALSELMKYDVISFDVFDTLIFRKVRKPTDIFLRMEKELHIPGFAEKRIYAEQCARSDCYIRKKTREISIEDIYRQMFCRQKANRQFFHGQAGVPGRMIRKMIKQEMEKELQYCYANPVMKKMIRSLAENHKMIIAVSDMYLHREQIRQILRKNGYEQIEKIYVSADYGVGKSDGRLFPFIINEWDPGRLIHIGDHFFSDIYRQKHLKMKTLHYLRNDFG